MSLLARSNASIDAVVDLYCERTDETFNFFAEPANTFTNLYQLALGVVFMARACRSSRWDINIAGGLLYCLVAIGAFVWHATGLNFTYFLDMFFPMLLVVWFGYHWLWRVGRIKRVWPRVVGIVLALVIFLGMAAIGPRFPLYAYTSVHWVWFVLLLVLALVHHRISTYQPRRLYLSVAILALSLFFYGLDKKMEADGACWPPVGWHWAWHVVSATGFFVLINVLPPEDHESPGLDLAPCYSCFRFTPFGKKRNKVGAAVAV